MCTRRQFIKDTGILGAGFCLYSLLATRPIHASESSLYKEALFYKSLPDKKIQCFLCPLNCILDDGQTCFCRTRTNKNGKLYTDAYNNPCILQIDPVEKAPLYHFLPGTNSLSVAEAGCNLRCIYCQNWEASQVTPYETKNFSIDRKQIINYITEKNLKSICFTYTEPVVLYEYLMDIASESKKRNIKVSVATACFIEEKPLKEMCKNVDAFVVSLKGWSEDFYKKICGSKLKPVLDALITIKQEKAHLEIVILILLGLNDDRNSIKEMCVWIKKNLGSSVPVHYSRFYPAYKLKNLPHTPLSTMEDSRKIAFDAGLKYVYLDNVPGHEGSNTYCPNCNKTLIERHGLKVLSNFINIDKCDKCGEKISGIFA